MAAEIFQDGELNSVDKENLLSVIRPPVRELLVPPARAIELKAEARELPSWSLTDRQVFDLELLLNGGYAPLAGFMGMKDFQASCEEMRLSDGTLWPIPVTLDIEESVASKLQPNQKFALRHPEGMVLALITVEDLWRVDDKLTEAELVYGTTDEQHPGVFYLLHQTKPFYVGGKIEGIQMPPRHTFTDRRFTPNQLRDEFDKRGWDKVVAFQTRNPMHYAHIELTKRAMEETGAALLIHPVVGPTKPKDVGSFARVRAYEAILSQYPEDRVILSVLPLAMRMAGPREAVQHAIIRRNYGATHFIVGRDHAGVRNGKNGESFYDPLAAQQLAQDYEEELGIKIVPFEEMVYVEEERRYTPANQVPDGKTILSISGTELRRRVRNREPIPPWFTPQEVIRVLEREFPPKDKQGITIFLTGLSGSGKSTIAEILAKKFEELRFKNGEDRSVTTLDGDIVRSRLTKGLGFSKEDRAENVRRVGFVASEVTKAGGLVVCSLIAPDATVRREVREMVEQYGGYVEVFVDTPLEECEARDVKGLYAQARAGKIQNFTGINAPYDKPEDPEVIVKTLEETAEEAANKIMGYLADQGYIKLSDQESRETPTED